MIPKRLHPGDHIGIVAPSDPITPTLWPLIQQGIAALEALGFRTVCGKYLTSTTWEYAASPQEKADDMNAMFADSSITAIMAALGGFTAASCLPYLDWEVIRTHPKIFIGISDVTALLNAIYAKTQLITFHGNDVIMWRSPTVYDQKEFVGRLSQGHIGTLRQNAPRQTIRGGVAEGTWLGGNIHCLLKLAGTPYWPDFHDAILFLEAVENPPQGCDHAVTQLKQMGVFDQIQGVVIGYIHGLQDVEPAPIQFEEIVSRLTAEYSFPILKINEFGHACPNTVLPLGVRVNMDADRQEIEICESCVQ